MIPTRKTSLITGLVVFFVGVVALFPARVAYHWFAPDTVQMSGIEGTLWSGTAAEFSTAGVYLRDLNWRVRPLALITGKLAVSVAATPSSGFLEANAAIGLGGNIAVSGLNGSVPLKMLAVPLRMPGLAGDASLQFERIDVKDGLPVVVDGTLAVANLVAPMIDPSPLGTYRAEFSSVEDGIVASVEDVGGVFDLAGGLRVSSDRSYEFIGQVAPTDRTPEKLQRQLRFLGSPNDRGQHEIRLEGSL